MTRNPLIVIRIIDGLLILLSGIGLGILMGLSVSPVLHIIIASVVAVVVGIVSALAGLQVIPGMGDVGKKPEPDSDLPVRQHGRVSRISPLPVTMLIVGLAAGACVGIYMRTNELFGANPQQMAAKWKDTGIEDKELKRRIFNQLFPETLPPQAERQDLMGVSDQPQTAYSQNGSIKNNVDDKSPRQSTATRKDSSKLSAVQEPHIAGLFALSTTDCELVAMKHGDELRARLISLNNKKVNASLKKCHSEECLETIKELLCSR